MKEATHIKPHEMGLLQLWLAALFHPSRAFEEFKRKPAPQWGLLAVLTRFIPTSLIVTLPLFLLGREPFTPSSLTFLTTNNYYIAQVFFLPIFGLTIWLLMSAFAYVVMRLAGKGSDFDQVLNIVGVGMLIPIPVVWAWDVTMIALNLYQLPVMAVSHTLFQLWEASIEAVGFVRLLRLGIVPAIVVALIINALYIALAAIFIR
jgi:Yip1 domain